MQTLLGDAISEATALVGTVDAEALHRPTPCAGWQLGQLLTHMIGEYAGFTATLTDGSATAAQFHHAPVTAATLQQDWQQAAAALQRAFADADPRAEVVLGGFGRLPVGVVLRMQLLDTAVHTWDVATALGHDCRPSPPTVDLINTYARQIAARSDTGSAFAAPVAGSDDDSDRWLQALRLLGRAA